MTLEEIVNNLKSAGQDYGQLFNNNPRMDNFASVLQQGLGQLIPSNADFKSPEAMRDWGTAAALNAPMGLTFIGKNAANWNPVKAAEAEKLLNAGVDPVQVWKEHLIGRMPDKSLFSEIDDSALKVRTKDFSNPYDSWGIDPQEVHGLNDIQSLLDEGISERGVHSLTGWAKHYGESLPPEGQWNPPPQSYYKEKLIEHQPLSKLYDFYKLKTRGVASESPMANGYFNGENNQIVINALTDKKQNLKNYSGARSVAVHELQHAIQDMEGWARGGSPEQMKEEALAMLRRDVESGEIPSTEQAMAMLPMAQQNAYRRLTGEAQARATQDRMNMNMQQRRDNYPLAGDKLSDIPLDQLINRYGDNGPSMSMSIKNPNLNFELLNKHLSGQKLTPEEMALYEKNGSAMETPQLQRYNLGNANAQIPDNSKRIKSLGYIDNWLHGRYSDYEQIDPNKTFYATQDPNYASIYAVEPSASSMGGKGLVDYENLKPNVMPVMIKESEILDTRLPKHRKIFNNDFYMKYGNGTPLTNKGIPDWAEGEDFSDMFNDTGSKFKGVFLDEGKVPTWNGGLKDRGVSSAIFDPKNIRSRFAAFDPLRKTVLVC